MTSGSPSRAASGGISATLATPGRTRHQAPGGAEHAPDPFGINKWPGPPLTGPAGPSAVLEDPDEVAVRVLDRGDQAAAHVLDILVPLGAGLEERLQGALDVTDVVINDGAALVAVGIKTDVLAVDIEADVVGLVHDRRDAQHRAEHGLGPGEVAGGIDHGLDAFTHGYSRWLSSHRRGSVGHWYDTRRWRNVTDGRTRLAGRPVRGEPPALARGGVPGARLGERGGRRGAGNLAAAQPFGRRRGGEPGRLADHDRGAGIA